MIELKNVSKKFGNHTAVNDVSFKIEKGEVVGFLGQNGAGKTTIMKLITGILAPNEGEIIINDEKISNKSKKLIGYMPENIPLYDTLTVKEFITFMAELKEIKRAERKIEVDKIISDLNLKSVENILIKNISRGFKQRVSLAGALIGNPEIILLDEPTVGLDPKQIIEIRNLIKSLKGKHTVLLSSHILSEVNQICEKVIIINNGKIVAVDTPSNLENKMSNNIITIIVEDPQNKMNDACKKIKEIIDIKLLNSDKKEQKYELSVKDDTDVRKELFKELPKYDITINELSKTESTLEDVFMSFIKEEGEA
ncbi:MAG: ABC transporter ATP-binding protein [Bacilli bacterium]|nr:ABC transporter ATP-binding protein [Bacilli bacterium]